MLVLRIYRRFSPGRSILKQVFSNPADMSKIILFAFVAVLVAVAAADDQYTTKYDNIDLNEILKSKRLLKGYVFCLLKKGPCTPDGEELKRVLPDAIETECSKCSEKQRNGARTVLHHLIDHEPEWWSELEKEYDPTGEYKKKYKAQAEKEGLKI